MKFTKMSLVAALLIGSSAMALENTKITGDANVYYHTTDKNASNAPTAGLFERDGSSADVSVNLNLTTDLLKNDSVAVSAGVGYTLLTTLGLEGQMVSGVWGGAHNGTKDASWMNEAWVAATSAKTTVKVGRMEIDSPLLFTETWTINKNTFDGALLINQDIPNTTLIGGYVGRHNGSGSGSVVATNGDFALLGPKGAYAAAAINNSWEPLTVQAWYYDVVRVSQAYWLQADLSMNGLMFGAQYATLSATNASGYAGMIGYNLKDIVTVKASYSSIGSNGDAGYNVATHKTGNAAAAGSAQSKMYTEAWWNYGKITQKDTNSFNVTIEGDVAGVALAAYYTNADQSAVAGNNDLSEVTLSATKSFGPIDASLVYINATVQDNNTTTNDNSNTLQVYLTYNF